MEKRIIKLDEQEIQEVKEIRQSTDTLVVQLGNIQYEKLHIDEAYSNNTKLEEQLLENFKLHKQREKEITKKLSEKYGVGTINIEKGEIEVLVDSTKTNDGPTVVE